MHKEILDYLSHFPKTWQTRKIKQQPEYVEYLNKKYPNYDLKTQILFLRNGLNKEPKCHICGNKLKKWNAQTCSPKCREALKSQKGETSIDKMKNSMIEKYGYDNPAYLKSSQSKRKETLIQNYGIPASPKNQRRLKEKSKEYKRKQEQTLKYRYNVTNPGQIKGHSERVKQTLIERYGVDSISNIPHLQEKRKDKFKHKLNELCDTVNILEVNKAEDTFQDKFAYPNDRITFKCNQCNTSETHPFETYKWRIAKTGTPCSKCSNVKSNRSLEEEEVAKYVESIYNGKVKRNVKTVIPPYELDVLIPDKNIAIEYCGLFWHQEDLLPHKDYHLMKHNMCNEKGIRLITIFQDEWKYKTDIVKDRLIHILTNQKPSVPARKCQIHEIDTKAARQFCEENHIQGYASSKIKLGLFNQSELVGVATFSKGNIAKGQKNKDGVWELSRLCFNSQYKVPGGAGKLLKHFIRNYEPEQIISYADKRWNTGTVYSNIGFEYTGDTSPNYWYIDGDKRIYRFHLRKQQDEPRDISEAQLRKQQGWRRIWDCGHIKFKWVKNYDR